MSDLSSLFGYDQFIFDIPNTIYYIDLTKEPVFFFFIVNDIFNSDDIGTVASH